MGPTPTFRFLQYLEKKYKTTWLNTGPMPIIGKHTSHKIFNTNRESLNNQHPTMVVHPCWSLLGVEMISLHWVIVYMLLRPKA
jgi:hypothetical protein